MLNTEKIKGIIFDYGGTLDSNGIHWAEVIWKAYVDHAIPVERQAFREAYVYGERYLATHPVIKPHHTFRDLLLEKIKLQMSKLVESGFLAETAKTSEYSIAVSDQCYNFAISTLQKAKPVLDKLVSVYPLVLVSNFYGNVEAVLTDFGLISYFDKIIESAVVGVRKPDPAIFSLGVEALGFLPEEIVVIGDSHSKDIIPATKIGCRTIWIKGVGWEEDREDLTADAVISDFNELEKVFNL